MANIQSSLIKTVEKLIKKETKKQNAYVSDKIRILVQESTTPTTTISEISF